MREAERVRHLRPIEQPLPHCSRRHVMSEP
ncbi:hypothetical protein B0I32_14313 [Nonomuraea fuscirosea]|uniref:Uncharacterized protein n=1 Tax=Nonomuraea fuscirosea TaxID=1291556 RepID=A0A2T0LT74_9ACTN|nr:hypothetical protein B0I32_14313 [Nonomuraea fuscirosea]